LPVEIFADGKGRNGSGLKAQLQKGKEESESFVNQEFGKSDMPHLVQNFKRSRKERGAPFSGGKRKMGSCGFGGDKKKKSTDLLHTWVKKEWDF